MVDQDHRPVRVHVVHCRREQQHVYVFQSEMFFGEHGIARMKKRLPPMLNRYPQLCAILSTKSGSRVSTVNSWLPWMACTGSTWMLFTSNGCNGSGTLMRSLAIPSSPTSLRHGRGSTKVHRLPRASSLMVGAVQ